MLKAFIIGFKDGYSQPMELSMGMTYDNSKRQWAWDTGANIGQWLGKLIKASK